MTMPIFKYSRFHFSVLRFVVVVYLPEVNIIGKSAMCNTTVVIFRRDRTGWKDCFALFPELPADEFGHYCDSLPARRPALCRRLSRLHCGERPGQPRRIPRLFEELERRGYNLVVRQRATPEMHERRRRVAAEWRAVKC